ncbi:MAG: 2-isopropylmalate synthase [Acidobacteriota bacterium]
MSERVQVFDTTLRDGEQAPGCSLTEAEKLEMAGLLHELGVDVIEAGFPRASEGDARAVEAIARTWPEQGVAALCRTHPDDVEVAARSLEPSHRPRLHVFIATSDLHLESKLGLTREQCLEAAVTAVQHARRFVDDVEFSAEDASRTDVDYLCKVAVATAEAGATTINVPDTVGYALPSEYGRRVARVVDAVGERAVVSVHCHDDLGLATANSLAGVAAGARQVECTVNGIGERAGNCSLEEIAMIVLTRQAELGLSTGIVSERLVPTSRRLAELIRFGPQPNKAIVGANAFAHEAGIHQDGMLKNRETYEIMTPQSVGLADSRLVLGKHSGRHALRERLAELGFSGSREQLDVVYRRFIEAADRRKGVMDAEIVEIAHEVLVVAEGEVSPCA